MNTARQNPYVGPRTFETNEGHLFYGREREALDLLSLVISERLVLFYAQSGAGKSSLINTKLIPGLEAEGEYQVLPIGRVGGGEALPGSEAQNIFIYNLVTSLLPHNMHPEVLSKLDLSEFVSSRLANMQKAGWKQVLIIDQFEELFSMYQEAWEKREDFFRQLGKAMTDFPSLWVVLVMREDFIAYLDPYANLLPGRLRVRYYMQRLDHEAALNAIRRPVELMRPFAKGVAEKLVDDLSRIKVEKPDGTMVTQPGQFVEPVQLQVVCYSLWESLSSEGAEITDEDLQKVGDVNQALERHYETRIKSVAVQRRVSERAIREWFGEKLITSTGTRNLVLQDRQNLSGELRDDVIQALQSDLVRAEQRGAIIFYELTHDRLVEPILLNNKKWEEQNLTVLKRQALLWDQQGRSEGLLLRGRELLAAEQEARKTELNDTEKKFLETSQKLKVRENRDRNLSRLLIFLTVGALMAMCAAVVFGFSSSRARREADEQRNIAVTQEALAASNAATAQASSQMAADQLRRSESLRFALQSRMLLLNEASSNPELATLLSIRSLSGIYVPEADAALVESMNQLYELGNFEGHTGVIRGIAVSPDGKYLATGGEDSTARLWDVETGETVRVFEGHTNDVTSVAFSPDSKFLLTGSFDNTAKLWDLATGEEIRTLEGHTDTILSVAYSPDGQYIVTGSNDNTAKLWNAQTGDEIRSFEGHEAELWAVAISPDGQYIATGSGDEDVVLWNLATGEELYRFLDYNGDVYCVAFSPDGNFLAAGGRDDSEAVVWNVESREKILTLIGHINTINSIAFSNDGGMILTGSFDGTAKLWNATTGSLLRTFSGHEDWVEAVAFSPDDSQVFTGSADMTARSWLTTGRRVERVFEDEGGINDIVFAADGKSVIAVSDANYAKRWNIESGQGMHTFTGHTADVTEVALSADGKLILTGANDRSARLWDLETDEQVGIFTEPGGSVWSVGISPDGKTVLTGGNDGTAILWDVDSQEKLRTFEGMTDGVFAVAFSPDGKQIITTDGDHNAKLWDLETGESILTVRHDQNIWDVVFSPDGKYFLTGALDDTAKLWDSQTGEEVQAFIGHDDRVFGVAFSPDGKYIATGSADNTAKIWETETGKLIRTLAGHTDYVYGVAFSPDGRYVATASGDGTVRLWDFDYHDTIKLACSVLTRDLTLTERERFGILDDSPTCPVP